MTLEQDHVDLCNILLKNLGLAHTDKTVSTGSDSHCVVQPQASNRSVCSERDEVQSVLLRERLALSRLRLLRDESGAQAGAEVDALRQR